MLYLCRVFLRDVLRSPPAGASQEEGKFLIPAKGCPALRFFTTSWGHSFQSATLHITHHNANMYREHIMDNILPFSKKNIKRINKKMQILQNKCKLSKHTNMQEFENVCVCVCTRTHPCMCECPRAYACAFNEILETCRFKIHHCLPQKSNKNE